jgi:hypothetical protein
MRLAQRLIAATVLLTLCGGLAGCGGGALGSNFDPSDLLDFLDTKKKLPGDRKPVFPEGVPGLQPGVPKELYRGATPEAAPEAVVVPPPEEPKAKRGTKSRAKASNVSRAPAAEPDPTAEEGATAAAPPAPKPQRIVRRRTTAPAADQTAPAAAEPAGSAPSSFPAPLPSGGFSR